MAIGDRDSGSRYKEMLPGLIRQRRNLIASSIALLVFELADVTLEKISILGNEVRVNNADSIKVITFVACLYFLVRYYQYIQNNHGTGLQAEYRSIISGLTRQQLALWTRSDDVSIGDLKRVGLGLDVHYRLIDSDSVRSDLLRGRIPWRRFVTMNMKAVWCITVNTPLATDYVLPYILAGTAISIHLAGYAGLFLF